MLASGLVLVVVLSAASALHLAALREGVGPGPWAVGGAGLRGPCTAVTDDTDLAGPGQLHERVTGA